MSRTPVYMSVGFWVYPQEFENHDIYSHIHALESAWREFKIIISHSLLDTYDSTSGTCICIYLGGQPERRVTRRGRSEETSGREIGGHDSLRLVEGLLSTLLWHLCPMQFALPLFSCTLFIAPQYILSRFFVHRNSWGFVGHLTAPQLIRLINNPCWWDTMSFVWSFHSVLFHSVPFCFIPFRSVSFHPVPFCCTCTFSKFQHIEYKLNGAMGGPSSQNSASITTSSTLKYVYKIEN